MSSERRKRRTRIVPQLIFQTAAAGLMPGVASCGGDVFEQTTTTKDAASEVAKGGTGNRGGSFGSGGGFVLAVGGFGTGGTGGSGGVKSDAAIDYGIIVLAIGGFGNGGSTDGATNDAGQDASPQRDASMGTGGIWVLAMNGFGGGGAGNPGNG